MAKYSLIIFNRDIDEKIVCIGARLIISKDLKKFMNMIDRLAENEINFYIGSEEIPYCSTDFSTQSISQKEFNKLKEYFGFENDEEQIGVFPDVLNDAVDYNILNEFEESDDYDENDEIDY